jgi:hypothetical protein
MPAVLEKGGCVMPVKHWDRGNGWQQAAYSILMLALGATAIAAAAGALLILGYWFSQPGPTG